MTDYLDVYKGESNENFVIDTIEEETGAVIDPSWGTFGAGETELIIKDTDFNTISGGTLSQSDFVSSNTTSVTVLIDKLGALAVGTYLAFLYLRDTGTRVKILKYHLRVREN